MSEPRKFTRYEDWRSACQVDGLEGPYQINGEPHMWQYVRKNRGGTAALWNYQHHLGYVFDGEGK